MGAENHVPSMFGIPLSYGKIPANSTFWTEWYLSGHVPLIFTVLRHLLISFSFHWTENCVFFPVPFLSESDMKLLESPRRTLTIRGQLNRMSMMSVLACILSIAITVSFGYPLRRGDLTLLLVFCLLPANHISLFDTF